MKKIVFAICFCFLSVAHVFAQDVVTDLYDRFDVRYSYLNVPGFSEQQIDQVVNALFKDFHKTRYNPETRTFRLCLMDFFYMFFLLKSFNKKVTYTSHYEFSVME